MLKLLALPRGAHEVGRFNGLRQGLGEWCLIAVQPVSEATPKPFGPRPIGLTVPINIYSRRSAEVAGSDSFGRADGTNHSVQNCVPDSILSEEYPRNRFTPRSPRHEHHGGPKLAARDITDLTDVPPLPACGATS